MSFRNDRLASLCVRSCVDYWSNKQLKCNVLCCENGSRATFSKGYGQPTGLGSGCDAKAVQGTASCRFRPRRSHDRCGMGGPALAFLTAVKL